MCGRKIVNHSRIHEQNNLIKQIKNSNRIAKTALRETKHQQKYISTHKNNIQKFLF